MSNCLLVIVMGARVDEPHARKIAEAASALGLDSVLRVGSAHKSPAQVLGILAAYEADPRHKVYVAIAGLSNALGGFMEGSVSSPVISCPPPCESYGGADLWSSLRMPSGIATAYVMHPANAALLAAKILAPFDELIAARIKEARGQRVAELLRDDAELGAEGPVRGPAR